MKSKKWDAGEVLHSRNIFEINWHALCGCMSKNLKRQFGFVNVSGGMFHDVTEAIVSSSYNLHALAA